MLRRTMVRKGIETAAVSANPNLTEAQRVMMADELIRDVNRCGVMIAVALNDFTDMESRLDSFESELSTFPPSLYSSYMEGMTDSERNDEGQYIWMVSAMISDIGMIRRGMGYAERLAGAEEVLGGAEVSSILRARDRLSEMMPRCEAVDSVGLDTQCFAETVMAECSLLLRVNTGKSADSSEICRVLDDLLVLDGEEFERVFGPDLGIGVMDTIAEISEPRGRFMSLLCGRCILNSMNS